MKVKKVVPTIIIALLAFNNLAAQNRIFQPYQPPADYRKGATLNIFENTIPFEFQFLIDDNLTKVIANPAKSFLFNSPFASAALDRTYNRSFSLGLINPKKWILFADYSGISEFNERLISDFENEVLINEDAALRDVSRWEAESVEDGANDQKNNFFEARLFKAFETNNSGYAAVGLFFGVIDIEWDGISENLSKRRFSRERFLNDTLRTINRSTELNQRVGDNTTVNSIIRSGLEFHYVKDEIETSQKVFLELRDNQNDYNTIYTSRDSLVSVDLNFGSNNTNIFYEQNSRISKISSQPIGLFYSGYFNKKLSMFGDDFVFSNIDFGYNTGELSFSNIFESFRVRTTNGISDTTLSDNNTNGRFRGKNTTHLNSDVSLGYAISKKTDNNYLFTGLIAHYNFEWIKDYSFDSNEFYKVTDRTDRVNISAPIYLSVALSEQVNIWGGGRVFYEYSSGKAKRDFEGFLDEDIVEPGIEMGFSSEYNDSGHSIDTQNFIGLRVSLESGIDLNIRFNSISSVNSWAVNIGYNF